MAEPKKTTSRSRTLAAVVLAAGKGERLRSATPKVLHPICGRPALWHVLQVAKAARPSRIAIVLGHGADDVRDAVRSWNLKPAPVFVEQDEQLGTGHAVLLAERAVGKVDDVLVLGGDYDPVTVEDVRSLVRTHRRSRAAATIATTEIERPRGYGHVVREGDRLVRIVEDADATPTERRIGEVALLVMVFRREDLYRALPLVGTENRQHEHYLPDVLPILMDKGEHVAAVRVDTGGAMGANARRGLAAVERVVRERIVARHMANGVTFVDPDTAYVDVEVRIGPDTVVMPMTMLQGRTKVGRGCTVGPSTRLEDATIGDRTRVEFAVVQGATIGRDAQVGRGCTVGPSTRLEDATVGDRTRVVFAVVQDATIGRDAQVGPFARLRPGTRLADRVIVGSYVEVKNSRIGRRSKVPHLSYVGDADVGKGANIGAANVTANWDGYEKHRTVIGDDVRTGSDTIMVAPVRIGSGAVTGAGSVISKDVPAGALAVERSEQRTVKGYRKRKDAEHRGRSGSGRSGH